MTQEQEKETCGPAKRRGRETRAERVQRLPDGLRLYGIHFPDVHLGNIRIRK